MSLPATRSDLLTMAAFDSHEEQQVWRNDSFSFWQLPDAWRSDLHETAEASQQAVEHFLFERYLDESGRRPPAAMGGYYRVKHLIPSRMRFRINSLAVRARPRRKFPNWPCESALIDLQRDWLRRALAALQVDDGWHIGFWPRSSRCCVVLTHDVESLAGLDLMEAVADVEEKYGFRSAWNLPLAQYKLDWDRVERLRARGFEFGAHGLCHDGRLFRSADDFAALSSTLHRLAQAHNLRGFRSPSTLRRAEWIAAMPFDFDSTFADTDPWEPQPGGTCCVFPFYLGQMIELPYTLPQDHTLLHLLKRDPLQLWILKARWIASLGGMILTLTHPDYSGKGRHLAEYEELLKYLAGIDNAWRALPSEVAQWWRDRSRMKLQVRDGRREITGPNAADAVAVRLSEEPLAN